MQVESSDAQLIVIGMDCSFFGRSYGIIVARSPRLKQNLYWKEITTENKIVYEEARRYLEQAGFAIKAVVIDAKHDLMVQICHYHQQQIIQRYLTNRPKTEAGQELRRISNSLTHQSEKSFVEALKAWRDNGNHYWRNGHLLQMGNTGIPIDNSGRLTEACVLTCPIYSVTRDTLTFVSSILTIPSKDILES